jgi:hypothetical protein
MNVQSKTTAKASNDEPWRNHYLNKAYLAGFTPSGKVDDLLFVHDLQLKKSWRDKPKNVGWKKYYHRLEMEGVSAEFVEEYFSTVIEAPSGSVIKQIINRKVLPNGKDFEILMRFVASTAIRVPTVRDDIARRTEGEFRGYLRSLAENPDQFTSILADYEKSIPIYLTSVLNLWRLL